MQSPDDRRQRQKTAAFAKAMARAEFGRFYTDDRREAEVRESVATHYQRKAQTTQSKHKNGSHS